MAIRTFNALGIDVGGTKIAAGLVTFPDGQVHTPRVIPTSPDRGSAAVLDTLVQLAEQLSAEASRAGRSLQAIGVGLCELVSPEGRILSANCLDWRSEPVRERLGHLGPVTIEADVRAAARAEALFGAGQPYGLFLYVTVGTGISSCLMIDGKPFVGARGATGTMASSPSGVTCESCGHVTIATLEEFASGPALAKRYNEQGPSKANTGRDIVAAAIAGDAKATEVVRSGGEALGASVGHLVNVLDPQAVIVGGGLGLSEGPYWDALVAAARRHIWSEVNRDLPILRAATGSQAGFIGAAAAAWVGS